MFVTLWKRNFRIFIEALLNSTTQVDTLRHRHHVCSLYIDLILAVLCQNCTCFCDFVMRDFMIFITASFNFPARVDTFRHQNQDSSLNGSDWSSSLKLETPIMRGSHPSSQGIYGLGQFSYVLYFRFFMVVCLYVCIFLGWRKCNIL